METSPLPYIGLDRQLVSFGLWPKQLPHKSCIFRTKVLKKCCFYKEVVQKLKFPNNSINEFEFYCKDAILYNEIMDLAKGKVKKEELIKFYEKYSRKK